MRLTCPNCGAQYEVPDDVIPTEGRDVQCSNCGTTWFQPHADQMDTTSETPAQVTPPPEDPTDLPEQSPVSDPVATEDDAQPAEPAPRRALDPEVTDILKEEAERENRLRADESAGLETQPDLGLADTADDAERRAQQARERMERLKGLEDMPPERPEADPDLNEAAIAAAIADTQNARKDRLPDIDELNSSLRPDTGPLHGDADGPDALPEAEAKTSFARGFAVPLLILAVLMLLYVAAPGITSAVPALEPIMAIYVGAVDQIRGWLDGLISGVAA